MAKPNARVVPAGGLRLDVVSGRLEQTHGTVTVVGALEGERRPDRLFTIGAAKDGVLSRLGECGFRGLANETIVVPASQRWLLVVGLGKAKERSAERLRQWSATAVRAARARGFRHVGLPIVQAEGAGSLEASAQAIAEGVVLGLYRFDLLRQVPKQDQQKRIEGVTIVADKSRDVAVIKRGVEAGQAIAEAVTMARDLINSPANIVNPQYLANQARELAKSHRLKYEVLGIEELKRQGFGGLVAVGQGSANPPQLIVLDYAPAKPKATLAFCGKGITFDSGGISIKPAENMEKMKYDMSGAAAVLGIVRAAASLKLPVRIVGIIGSAENMPSGTAQRPGDVVRTLSGKTVEVINTDAEGRLVLADCLHFAKRFKPACVIDVATLTGACVVALGGEAVGLFTRHDRLAARLTQSGDATNERLWRMPLWDEYAQLIKSDIADMRNAGSREAGACSAARFLDEFAEGLTWAHLDIAGTAWTERDKPYVPKGAVGVGVRLLIDFAQKWS